MALAAQGFGRPQPARPTLGSINTVVGHTQVLQIDSVNVLQRAHYMPVYARIGPYPLSLLHRAAQEKPRRLVEYWAHEAALMPASMWPLMQHRMATAHTEAWGGPRSIAAERPDFVNDVRQRLEDCGPSTARALDRGAAKNKDHWGWNWSDTKKALEFLFFAGEISAAGRNSQFERLYDVTERVVPAAVLAQPTPAPADAIRDLVRKAARAHGIATQACLADYFRLRIASVRPAVADLLESGELREVRVQGWTDSAYVWHEAKRPRRVEAATLLSPFDPLVWFRPRAEGLFNFRYRIEIYTPAEKRQYGYYVLPFLLDEQLAGRVDLKADRSAGVLRVLGAYAEVAAPAHTAAALAGQLRRLADWLGLTEVDVAERGDLAVSLRAALG